MLMFFELVSVCASKHNFVGLIGDVMKIKDTLGKIFPPKKMTENFVQYIIRQTYLSDTSGRPSLTVTILLFVMGIVAYAAGTEFALALSKVTTIKPDGTTITAMKGFSSEFMYLLIALSVVITKYFNDRSARYMHNGVEVPANTPDTTELTPQTIIEKAVGMVSKIKGAK